MKVLRLDELEPTHVEGTIWKPIRSTLGIRAFGINAYVAELAGDPSLRERTLSAGRGRPST